MFNKKKSSEMRDINVKENLNVIDDINIDEEKLSEVDDIYKEESLKTANDNDIYRKENVSISDKINEEEKSRSVDNIDEEILKIASNIDINEDEFDNIDVNLNDVEKKRIKNTYRKAIKTKKHIYRNAAIAAGIVAVIGIGGVFGSPVMASRISVLNNIYETLGIYDEYKDYTTYVGESVKAGRYTYTVEQIMVTPHKSLLGIKITSDDIILEEHQGFMTSLEIGGVHWNSAIGQNYRIDDNTLFTAIEYEYENKVPRKATIKLNIHSNDSSDDSNDTNGELEFKADFDRSYDEFTSKDINNVKFNKYGLTLDSINASIMGTNIVSTIKSKEDDEQKYLSQNDKLEFLLKVDDKIYGGNKSCHLGSKFGGTIFGGVMGIATTHIDNLNFDEFMNAENITLLAYEAKYSNDEIIDLAENDEKNNENSAENVTVHEDYSNNGENVSKSDEDTGKSDWEDTQKSNNEQAGITEQGITYIKEQKFADGTRGILYDLERNNNSIIFKYKGKESDIVPLSQYLYLYTKEEAYQRSYKPVVYKGLGEGEFIIVFNNIVEDGRELIMTDWNNGYNEYSLVKEVEIK